MNRLINTFLFSYITYVSIKLLFVGKTLDAVKLLKIKVTTNYRRNCLKRTGRQI